jgi:hypothetical protein
MGRGPTHLAGTRSGRDASCPTFTFLFGQCIPAAFEHIPTALVAVSLRPPLFPV